MSLPRDTSLSAQLRQAREQLDALRLENQILRQKLDALARRVFGKSSERLDPEQLQLLLEGLEEIAEVRAVTQRSSAMSEGRASVPRERGPRLPTHLPVREVIID